MVITMAGGGNGGGLSAMAVVRCKAARVAQPMATAASEVATRAARTREAAETERAMVATMVAMAVVTAAGGASRATRAK